MYTRTLAKERAGSLTISTVEVCGFGYYETMILHQGLCVWERITYSEADAYATHERAKHVADEHQLRLVTNA